MLWQSVLLFSKHFSPSKSNFAFFQKHSRSYHVRTTRVHSSSGLLFVLEPVDPVDPLEPTEEPLDPIPEGKFSIYIPLYTSCERREISFISLSITLQAQIHTAPEFLKLLLFTLNLPGCYSSKW